MLIKLASYGLLIALLPLTMVWVSDNPDKYRKLVWITLFLTFDLIMFGAFTRLTDSGLGCPDWPGCYSRSTPIEAHADISAAERADPHGPVTVFKAWIEMIHRYFAIGIGVLITALMLIAWHRWIKSRGRNRKFLPAFPTALFVFVCLQGAFGAWTVTMLLHPFIVTTHLMLGMALLALLTWLGARQTDHPPVEPSAATLRIPVVVALALLVTLIALGGWVSSNYAAWACPDLPLCVGSAFPSMDFSNGFTLWRNLHMTADGKPIPHEALVAIHWTHRVGAIIVAVYITWVALRALNTKGLQRTAYWLLSVTALQFTAGISLVLLHWPLLLAVAHNGGAALLLFLITMLAYKVYCARHETGESMASPTHATMGRRSPAPSRELARE
ncbi:MAG: cytochrome C oxidase subunit I [Betaproteobacteria bacterium RIFCSPLOWO2_02_FULL_63_19]|nr:MAG: cytochrome C oxidase subunit I [Betaproteobacteria bacterium RIFCSPLOWO2_02_FULL_63_19]